jgi:uridine kinase
LLATLADRIAALERPHPLRVAIDGCSGAGKSTFAAELARVLETRGHAVICASVDDFHRPRAERYRWGRLSPEGYYQFSFNYPAIRNLLLLPLSPGGNRRYRTANFDQVRDLPVDAPEHEAPPDAIALIDGCFLFRPELADLWDYRVFVHADVDVAVARAIARDMTVAPSLARVQETYRERYIPGERIYLDTIRPREKADLVVDNTELDHPVLLDS